MTITNNTKRIEELVGAVTILVDNRKYEDALCAIDNIENCCLALKNDINHLRLKADSAARPAGGD